MALTLNNFWGAETGGAEETSASNGGATISSSSPITGSYHYVVTTGSTSYFEFSPFESVADADATDGGGYVLGFNCILTNAKEALNMPLYDDSASPFLTVETDTSGEIFVRNSAGTIVVTSTSTPFGTLGVQHFVEVYFTHSNSGEVTVKVDGTTVATTTGQDFLIVTPFDRIRFAGGGGSATIAFDDLFIMSGATSVSDMLGASEVFAYRSTKAGGDKTVQGANGGLDEGTFADAQEVPFVDVNFAAYTDSLSRGEVVYTNDVGGSAGTGGPDTDTNIEGDSNIIAMKGIWRMKRSGGSGAVHHGVLSNSGDASITTECRTVDFDPTTAYAQYFDVRVTPELPTASEHGAIGFYKDNKGQDFDCADMLFQILHVPSGVVERVVTTIPEVIAVVENVATVVKNVPRDVGCIPEAIAVVENDSIVNIGIPRVVTGISEVVAVVESDSAIDLTRGVGTIPEAIAVIENDSTVDITMPRLVTTIPELVAVTENDATVNRSRNVAQADTLVTANVDGNKNITDADAAWTDDANAFDGSTGTYAYNTSSGTVEILLGRGTDVIHESGHVIGVDFRFYAQSVDGVSLGACAIFYQSEELGTVGFNNAAAAWSEWFTLTAPAAGWSKDIVADSLKTFWYRVDDGQTGELRAYTSEIRVSYFKPAIRVIENDAVVSLDTIVAGIPEVIAVIENDATVDNTLPRDVTTVSEAIAVIENAAAVNGSRNVVTPSRVVDTNDSFTDADDVLISAHTPDIGPSWQRHGSGTGEAKISGNKLVGNVVSTFDEWVIESGVADGTITCLAHIGSPFLTSNVGIIFRSATTANSSNHVQFALTENGASLIRVSTASGTQNWGTVELLGSNLNTTRNMRIELSGNNMKCYVDDVLHFNANDSVHAAETLHGFRFFGDSGNWLDDFKVVSGGQSRIRVVREAANINREEGTGTIPERIAVVKNDAIVTTGVNLDVTCTPEAILVTENDAVVNTNQFRSFTTIPEVVAVIENSATISYNIPRVVAAFSESIAVNENISQIFRGTNLAVSCTPESIAVIESPAQITKSALVSCIPEVVALTENPSVIALDRTVTGLPESIQVIELLSTVIRGVASTRRIMIVG